MLRQFGFAFAILIFAFRGSAQDAPEKKLSFQDCVRLALAKNEGYLNEKKTVETKDFALKQKWETFLPSLSASTSYSQSYPDNNGPFIDQGYGESLSSSYNLFNGFQDVKGYRRSRLEYADEQNKLTKTRNDLIHDLKVNFENLRAQQELIEVTKGILKLRRDNEKLVQVRFQSGRENKGSYLDAQTSTAQAELDFYKSKIDRRNQTRALAVFLNEDLGQDIVVTDDIPPLREAPVIKPNIEKEHPDYLSTLFKREEATIDADVAKLKFLPSLSIDGNYGIKSATLPIPLDNAKNWGFNITLTLPLYNSGPDYFDVLSKQASLAISEIQLHKQVNDIKVGMQNAYDGLEISKRSYDIAVKKLESMKIREKLARERYNIGVINYDDWNQIVQNLIDSQTGLINAKKDKINAEASWISAQGRGDLE